MRRKNIWPDGTAINVELEANHTKRKGGYVRSAILIAVALASREDNKNLMVRRYPPNIITL